MAEFAQKAKARLGQVKKADLKELLQETDVLI